MMACTRPHIPLRPARDDTAFPRRAPGGAPLTTVVSTLALLLAAAAAPLPAQEAEPPPDRDLAALESTATDPDTTAEGRAAPLSGRPWHAWLRDGAAFASLLALDRPVRSGVQDVAADATEASLVDRVADRAEWFGDWQGSLPWVVGGTLGVGALTGGTQGLEEGAALLAGTAAAAMANETVNRAVGRGRPSWGEGVLHLEPFRGHASFPSGHTAYVFGVASGIDVVTEGWAPAAAAYGVAGLTGLSRIYHDRHWLTDVVAGATLATVVSRVATRRALRLLGTEDARDEGATRGDRRTAGAPGSVSTAGERAGPPRIPRGLRVEPLVTARALGVTLRF